LTEAGRIGNRVSKKVTVASVGGSQNFLRLTANKIRTPFCWLSRTPFLLTMQKQRGVWSGYLTDVQLDKIIIV
jgi:hypothetical protein